MRAKEVLSSVGAGGSLIAAGLVSLLLFSSLLAYKARPGGADETADGTVAMRTPPAKADGRAASGPVPAPVVVAAAPVRREAGDTPRSRSRPRLRRDGSAAPAPDRTAAPVFSPSAPAGSAPATAAAPGQAPAAEPAPRGPGGGGGGGGGGAPTVPIVPSDPVQTVTDTGRQVVEQVTEPLPPVVEEPVGTVLDTADDVAGTVDDTLGQTLPGLLP